jgi:hypothetical protein
LELQHLTIGTHPRTFVKLARDAVEQRSGVNFGDLLLSDVSITGASSLLLSRYYYFNNVYYF